MMNFAIKQASSQLFYNLKGVDMSCFNYHAKAQNLIKSGHLVRFEVVPKWGSIAPALVLFFDNNKPMPIREYRFDEYLELINSLEIVDFCALK